MGPSSTEGAMLSPLIQYQTVSGWKKNTQNCHQYRTLHADVGSYIIWSGRPSTSMGLGYSLGLEAGTFQRIC